MRVAVSRDGARVNVVDSSGGVLNCAGHGIHFQRLDVSGAVVRKCFFFSSRRRHTRCSRDWSSDVCSSDLMLRWLKNLGSQGELMLRNEYVPCSVTHLPRSWDEYMTALSPRFRTKIRSTLQIGRASCRERV